MGYRARREISGVCVRVIMDPFEGQVTVRNASKQGAMLEQCFDAEIGDALILQLRDRRFAARIAWTNGTATGVAFDSALRPAELALFTGRAGHAHSVAHARVGFAGYVALRK
ncbi:hypothetical protein [Boseongicola aestuarii]|uniref:PilZ domain-containing protein n=1 Tax=Boseongicola aestuarii TaxID=1470561 RepID=A0A238J3A1_9RHOB|nr:hypothetical protein [Boseongicola aestuarii]SMX24712.1 hypothetical protein BOA8489_02839 [Boseongicola aestuarii]